MSSSLSPELRTQIEHALVWDDLRRGRGDARQQAAFRELEWRRCEASYEYFQRNYAYIQLKSGDIVRFEPYPIQVDSGAEWERGESTIEVKARQLGQTTNAAIFMLWDCIFHEATIWNVVSKEEDSGKDVLSRCRPTLDRLPKWLVERARNRAKSAKGFVKKQDQAESTLVISFGLSKITVLTSTPKKVQGRAGKILMDDFGLHDDQKRKWHILKPAITDPDPDNRGQVIFIFNGNGEDGAYWLYQAAKRGDAALRYHFYDWKADPRRTWMCDSATREGPHCRLSDKKEVYPWYEEEKRSFFLDNPEADEFSFRAFYPETEEEAFFLHGNSRFHIPTLNQISKRLKEERTQDVRGNRWPKTGFMVEKDDSYEYDVHPTGKVRLYYPPEPGAEYIVAVDAAGGRQASDYCVAMVGKIITSPTSLAIDTPAIEQVCVYQAKVEPQDELAYTALALARWYNDALILPETGSSGHGQSFVNAIKDDYQYIYKEIRTNRLLDEEKEELGFATTSSSRNPLINGLATWLGFFDVEANDWRNPPRIIIHDQSTLTELDRFEINPDTGKATAPKGGNDDLVITAGLLVHGCKHVAMTPSESPSRYLSVYD